MKIPAGMYLTEFSEETIPYFNSMLQRIVFAINSIEFGTVTYGGENIFCSFVVVVSPATPDEAFTLAHTLNKIPVGIIPIWKNKAGDFYYADATSAWTADNIYLKCSTASCSAVLILI